jgi:hypothetical protein
VAAVGKNIITLLRSYALVELLYTIHYTLYTMHYTLSKTPNYLLREQKGSDLLAHLIIIE